MESPDLQTSFSRRLASMLGLGPWTTSTATAIPGTSVMDLSPVSFRLCCIISMPTAAVPGRGMVFRAPTRLEVVTDLRSVASTQKWYCVASRRPEMASGAPAKRAAVASTMDAPDRESAAL